MTISITSKTPVNIAAWHQTFDEQTGIIITIGGTGVFLTDKEADDLGRYLLFDNPESTTPEDVSDGTELNQEDTPPA